MWRITMPASRFAAWAGNLTEIGVTNVTEVIGPQKPPVSAGLGKSFEVTRAAEAKVTKVTSSSVTMEVTPVTQLPIAGLSTKVIDDHGNSPGNPSYPGNGTMWPSAQLPDD